jgi:hypothetical protein
MSMSTYTFQVSQALFLVTTETVNGDVRNHPYNKHVALLATRH